MAVYIDNLTESTATILSGATVSSAVNLSGKRVIGIYIPVMTGTSLAVTVSRDGTNYVIPYNGTTAVTYTAAATARFQIVNPEEFLQGAKHIKFTSNGAEGADRAITVVHL